LYSLIKFHLEAELSLLADSERGITTQKESWLLRCHNEQTSELYSEISSFRAGIRFKTDMKTQGDIRRSLLVIR